MHVGLGVSWSKHQARLLAVAISKAPSQNLEFRRLCRLKIYFCGCWEELLNMQVVV